jgi:hypothetical protein
MPFIYLAYLLGLALPKLSRNDKNRHPCFLPDVRRKPSVFIEFDVRYGPGK